MSDTLELAKQLINIESITPEDNGCQDLLIEHLKQMNFSIDKLPSGNVKNFWARRGTKPPLFVFAGHTDVVPPGPLDQWTSPPFNASVRNNHLYGRGAADMKSALASMIISCKQFLTAYPEHQGSIGFLITSDEEGEAKNGTVRVVEYLQQKNIPIDWCMIGEASSDKQLGDVVKIGRRGSLHGKLQVFGKQGHIAYPQLAENPIHRCFKALDTLTQIEWDQGNEYFSPTSLQIYKIVADTGASNVIPGSLQAHFNFRFAPTSTEEKLKNKVIQVFDEHKLNYEIDWNLSGKPFFSPRGKLMESCQKAIAAICNIETTPNTTGGTSDGRFISATGCEILELGHCSKSIHKINENVKIENLNRLTEIYKNILERLLT